MLIDFLKDFLKLTWAWFDITTDEWISRVANRTCTNWYMIDNTTL